MKPRTAYIGLVRGRRGITKKKKKQKQYPCEDNRANLSLLRAREYWFRIFRLASVSHPRRAPRGVRKRFCRLIEVPLFAVTALVISTVEFGLVIKRHRNFVKMRLRRRRPACRQAGNRPRLLRSPPLAQGLAGTAFARFPAENSGSGVRFPHLKQQTKKAWTSHALFVCCGDGGIEPSSNDEAGGPSTGVV